MSWPPARSALACWLDVRHHLGQALNSSRLLRISPNCSGLLASRGWLLVLELVLHGVAIVAIGEIDEIGVICLLLTPN